MNTRKDMCSCMVPEIKPFIQVENSLSSPCCRPSSACPVSSYLGSWDMAACAKRSRRSKFSIKNPWEPKKAFFLGRKMGTKFDSTHSQHACCYFHDGSQVWFLEGSRLNLGHVCKILRLPVPQMTNHDRLIDSTFQGKKHAILWATYLLDNRSCEVNPVNPLGWEYSSGLLSRRSSLFLKCRTKIPTL